MGVESDGVQSLENVVVKSLGDPVPFVSPLVGDAFVYAHERRSPPPQLQADPFKSVRVEEDLPGQGNRGHSCHQRDWAHGYVGLSDKQPSQGKCCVEDAANATGEPMYISLTTSRRARRLDIEEKRATLP